MNPSVELVAAVLAHVAGGETEAAIALISGAEGLPEQVRQQLADDARRCSPADFAERMAKALRDDSSTRDSATTRDAVNECNRAAFYLSGRSRELAGNPLYALFLAGRDGLLLDKWVHYFDVYHRALEKYRGTSPRVLEIGVYKGGGLALWRSYFGPGAVVVGIDIDPAAADHGLGSAVLIGDQADPSFLEDVDRDHGPFDVVIDDGGHSMNQQITAVETLFPRLATGGTYVVEDTHTSYWQEYRDRDGTFVDWIGARIDSLHANHDPAGDPESPWATTLGPITVSDSITVLTKVDRFRPFSEVAGTTDFLSQSRVRTARVADLEQQRSELAAKLEEVEARLGRTEGSPPSPESDEVRTLRAALKDSRRELRELAGRVQALESELSSTQGRLLDAWQHIRGMRNTVSWRITTPLRAGRLFNRS